MITTTSTGGDAAVRVLARAQASRVAERAAAAELLATAAEWADLHPAGSLDAAAVDRETDETLGGLGVVLVDAMAVAEFASIVMHGSAEVGFAIIGDALTLRHRLPRIWRLVHAGQISAWDARSVAAAIPGLSDEVAGYVDRMIMPVAGRIGPVRLQRLVEAAILQFMPAEAERRAAEHAEQRRFTISHPGRPGSLAGPGSGLSIIDGVLDLIDALDPDAAITDGARHLAQLGDTSSENVRRARAAGDLARRQPCLSDDQPSDAEAERVVVARQTRPTPRQVTLVLHLAAEAVTGDIGCTGAGLVGRIQNTRTPITAEQIRIWLGAPNTTIIIKPLVDVNQPMAVDCYEIPDRIRERVTLRNPTCVFPWCTRRADACDLDHITPYDPGSGSGFPPGQTSTDNLAPLCRRHHRLKTFAGWRYRVHDRPGSFHWTSPYGHTYLTDHDGTAENREPDI